MKDHEATFRRILNQSCNKLEANLYVYECLMYFYRAGYAEDQIEKAEVLMKKIVQEWAYAKFNVGTKPIEPPKPETTGDFLQIPYFDPLRTYTFEITGGDATWVQSRVRQYWENMVKKRSKPGEGRLSPPKITLIDPSKE